MSLKGRRNAYICEKGHMTVTVDVDEGTTPFMIRCRYAWPIGCEEMAQSCMYQPPPEAQLHPSPWEWYHPTEEETAKLSEPMQDHVRRFGLLLRRSTDPQVRSA